MNQELFDLTKMMDFEVPLTHRYFRPIKLKKLVGTFVENKQYGTTRFHVGIPIKQISIIRLNAE